MKLLGRRIGRNDKRSYRSAKKNEVFGDWISQEDLLKEEDAVEIVGKFDKVLDNLAANKDNAVHNGGAVPVGQTNNGEVNTYEYTFTQTHTHIQIHTRAAAATAAPHNHIVIILFI